ncbi:MAG: L,D-transpeptidase family protein [Planctomycetaceae bacterium]
MEPFVQQQKPSVPWHLWLTALAAGLFFIWCFELIPRVLTDRRVAVRPGEVAVEGASVGVRSADWSDISGASGDLSGDSLTGGAARQTADDRWTGLSEPESEAESEQAAGEQSVGSDLVSADGGVRQAAWESEGVSSERALPADLAAGLRRAGVLRQEDDVLAAHAELSGLYWKYPQQRKFLTDELQQSARVIFLTAERQFGDPHIAAWGETLESIGREYDLPWQYLARLNGIEPRDLQAGQSLKVVRGPFGAVVDLSSFTLTVHMHGWYVQHYRIGTGQNGRTPTGRFKVLEKLENPTWYNPDGGVIESDDPENPLGEYWLGLGDHIGIHGTIDADSIGRASSRGCLHLGDEDICEVFGLLGPGSEVVIRR